MADVAGEHDRTVVEQFARQAIYFAKLPGHAEATQLLLQMGGVGEDNAVLDMACGAGGVACAAARVAQRVCGIDLTPAMIEQARAAQSAAGLSNIAWHVGNIGRLPFPAASFDIVFTRYSLHHLLQPEQALAEMARVCRPRGRVVVADLVLPPEQAVAYDRMERIRDPSHVRVLSEPELARLITNCGLSGLRWAGYLFEISLDQLLEASFPGPGGKERVREMIEGDVGTNALGIGAHRVGGGVRFAYPIAVVTATKPAE